MPEHRTHIIGQRPPEIDQEDTDLIEAAMQIILAAVTCTPDNLRPSLLASVCITVLVGMHDNPTEPWDEINRHIRDGIQTAAAIRDSEGSA